MPEGFQLTTFARTTNLRLAALGVCSLALLLFAQSGAELNLWQAWQTEEYSHGIVVVLLAILIALHRLQEAKPVVRPSWSGVPLLAMAGGMQCVAQLAAFDTIAEYGLIVGLVGLCLSFLGTRATRAMLPGLIYLIFAVPLPHLFQATLSQKLQLLSSSLGVLPLELLGIPVFQEGNVIDLGGFSLQVVEACNGLRYLFPLMSFGYLVALLLEARFWKRAVIFLSTIPIAVLLNASRIAVIGVTVDLWGQKMAEGFIHDFEGWSVFILCLAILLGETYLLQRIGKAGRFRYEYLSLPKRPLVGGVVNKLAPPVLAFLLTLASALVFGTNQLENIPEIHPAHPPLASFPLSLGAWEGQQSSLSPDVLNALQLSDYWLADYKTNTVAASINLYIAYYESQRIGATTHSPSNCIPGGGWQIESSEIKTLALPSGVNLKMTQLLIRRGNNAQLVNYWFQERGRDLTETTIAKWYLLVDSLLMHRTDGALVRLGTTLAPGEDKAAAEARLNSFLPLAYPPLTAFIPSAPVQ
jgi:exosortase D (VPLPA-CTERM-specific)